MKPVRRRPKGPRRPLGLVPDVASAGTITLRGTGKYRITGAAAIFQINGVKDGDEIILLPSGFFTLTTAGNISPVTTTAFPGRPIHFVVMNNIVYEVGPSVAPPLDVSALGVSTGGNTAGNTGLLQGSIVLQGGANITLSQLTALGVNTIMFSAGGGTGGAADGVNILAAGTQTAQSTGTVFFSNTPGGITFGMTNSSIITAFQSIQTQSVFRGGMSNLGNTSGTTGTVEHEMLIVGGNNITVSQSINGASATLTISGPNTAAQSVQTQNLHNVTLSGNTSGVLAHISSGTMTLAGGNNITLSQAGNAVTISAANTVAQSVQTQNMIALTLAGNTSGALALVSSGTLTLAGGNNITLSQAGNAVTISAGAGAAGSQSIGMHTSTAGGGTGGTSGYASGSAVQYNFFAGSNITLSQSVNAASGSLSIYGASGGAGGAPTVQFWGNAIPANTGNSQLSNAALVIWPLNVADIFPGNMTVSTMFLNLTGTVSTGTRWSRTYSLGFYTMVNSTQLSLLFSASTSIGSSTNNASMATSFAGYRWMTFHSSQFNAQPTFSQTKYWFAIWERSSSGAQSFSLHGQSHFVHTSVRSGFMNAAANSATTQGWHPFNGNYSASFSTAMPSSIAASAVNKTGATAVANFIPNIYFNNLGSNIV